MQFTNQNEFKANLQNTTTTTPPAEIIATTNENTDTTGSCASSTDSGIIIIDNNARTYSNNKNNSNNNNNNNSNNDSNNININNDSKNKTTNKNIRKDNIFDVNKENEKLKNDNSSEYNTINIENIINISKNNDKNVIDDVISDTTTTPKTAAYANNDRWQNHEEKPSQQRQNDYYNKSNENTSKCAATATTTTTTTTTNIKNCSPTTSIRSTTISIVSIDENAIDSSVVDSDSDFEADAEGVHSNYVVKKLGQQVTYPPNSENLPNINKGLRVISQKISPGGRGLTAAAGVGSLAENILNGGLVVPATSNGTAAAVATTPQIGSIALTNSTDVTFGDKHFFEGPVTIQQIVIDSRDKAAKRTCNDCENGHDNPMFSHDDVGGDLSGKNKFTQKESSSKFISNRKAVIITSAIILLTIIIGIIIVTTSTIFKTSYGKNKNDNNTFNGTLQIVKRDDWSARESGKDFSKLKLPAHRVVISHTASDTCSSREVCDYRLRVIQAFHMDSMQWADIGYNFLVGGDGLVYEGRGWDIMGAHTKGYNTDSIGISFIGTFTAVRPTEAQLNCTQLLLEDGVRLKKLAPDYRLYGHRQLSSTESPGDALYSIIKTWKNWSSKI